MEMSLRAQPATVVEERSAGALVAETTTGFSGTEWWSGLFLLAFTAFWAASLAPLIGSLGNGTVPSRIFAFAFSAFWIPFGGLLGLMLIWGVLGRRETLVMDGTNVVLRLRLGPFVVRRVRKTSKVSDFRVLAGDTVFPSGHAVAFSASGRTIRFGNWRDWDEAEAVAKALSKHRLALMVEASRPAPAVIEFRARPEWARDYFLLLSLTAWVAGGSGLLIGDDAFHGWQTASVTAAWVLGAVLVAASLVRDVFRRQRVSVGPTGLEIERSIGPLRRVHHYDRASIGGLDAAPVFTEDGPEQDRSELLLHVGRRTVRFGIALTPAEAEAAARELNERLDAVAAQ